MICLEVFVNLRKWIKEFGEAFVIAWYYSLFSGVFFILFSFKDKLAEMVSNLSMWISFVLPTDLVYGSLSAILLTPFMMWALRLHSKKSLVLIIILTLVNGATIFYFSFILTMYYLLIPPLVVSIVGLGLIGFLKPVG
jgi:hypothetical protein